MNFLEHMRLLVTPVHPPAFAMEGQALSLFKDALCERVTDNIIGASMVSDRVIELRDETGIVATVTFSDPRSMDRLLATVRNKRNGG